MDWRKEATEKLRNHEAQLRALESISARIKELEETYTALRSAKLDGMAVKGSGTSNREEAMLANITRRDDLRRWLKDAELSVAIVEGAMSVLSEEERQVLDKLYIHRMKGSPMLLCELLNIDKTTVYNWRDKALRRFTIALYGAVETP